MLLVQINFIHGTLRPGQLLLWGQRTFEGGKCGAIKTKLWNRPSPTSASVSASIAFKEFKLNLPFRTLKKNLKFSPACVERSIGLLRAWIILKCRFNLFQERPNTQHQCTNNGQFLSAILWLFFKGMGLFQKYRFETKVPYLEIHFQFSQEMENGEFRAPGCVSAVYPAPKKTKRIFEAIAGAIDLEKNNATNRWLSFRARGNPKTQFLRFSFSFFLLNTLQEMNKVERTRMGRKDKD